MSCFCSALNGFEIFHFDSEHEFRQPLAFITHIILVALPFASRITSLSTLWKATNSNKHPIQTRCMKAVVLFSSEPQLRHTVPVSAFFGCIRVSLSKVELSQKIEQRSRNSFISSYRPLIVQIVSEASVYLAQICSCAIGPACVPRSGIPIEKRVRSHMQHALADKYNIAHRMDVINHQWPLAGRAIGYFCLMLKL